MGALASVIALLGTSLSACDSGDATGPDNLTYPLVIVGVAVRDLYNQVVAVNGTPLWLPCRTEVTTKLTIQKNGAAVLEISGPKKTGGGVTDAAGNRDCSITEPIPEGWYLNGTATFSSTDPDEQVVTFQSCNSGIPDNGDIFWDNDPVVLRGEVSCLINSGNDPFRLGKPAMRTIATTGQP